MEIQNKILRDIYLLGEGNVRRLVSLRELQSKNPQIPPGNVREHCRHLQELGLVYEKLEVNYGLTASGVARSETDMWREVLRKKVDPELSAHLGLLRCMEWWRFRILVNLQRGRSIGGYVDLNPVVQEASKQPYELEAALAYLEGGKHIQFRGNYAQLRGSSARLTNTGAELADNWEQLIQGQEIGAKDSEKFQIVLERERRKEILGSGERGPKEPGQTFPTPDGAEWNDVAIRLIDDSTASVTVKGVSRMVNATQMGMVDSRTAMPDKQWELLADLAEGHGILNWNSPRARPRRQKQKARLSESLRTFFGLPGDPILWDKEQGEWRAVFRVSRGSWTNPPRSMKVP